MIFFGGVGRNPVNSRLDFGGDSEQDPDSEIFLKDSLFAIATSTDS